MKAHLVYLALGSNLNHPLHQVSYGLNQLAQHPHITLIAQSPFYGSSPMGPQHQPAFINAVAAIKTTLSPFDLLAATQAMEKKQGRPPIHEHWGPRTLDIDILLYNDEKIHTDTLVIPHPQMHHRPFVMEPLQDVMAQLSCDNEPQYNQLLPLKGPNDSEANCEARLTDASLTDRML